MLAFCKCTGPMPEGLTYIGDPEAGAATQMKGLEI